MLVCSLIKREDFPAAQTVKNPPAMQETRVQSLGQEEALEKGMATHSSILAWRSPWTEKPGRLQFVGLQRDTTGQLIHTHTHTDTMTHPHTQQDVKETTAGRLPTVHNCAVQEVREPPAPCAALKCSLGLNKPHAQLQHEGGGRHTGRCRDAYFIPEGSVNSASFEYQESLGWQTTDLIDLNNYLNYLLQKLSCSKGLCVAVLRSLCV